MSETPHLPTMTGRRTPAYRIPWQDSGEILSARVHRAFAEIIERQLGALADIAGDGVIAGLEIEQVAGTFQVSISEGQALISGIHVYRPNELQSGGDTIDVGANNSVYVYARLARSDDPPIGESAPYPSSYTGVYYVETAAEASGIPTDAIVLARVTFGATPGSYSVDTSMRRDISHLQQRILLMAQRLLRAHTHDYSQPLGLRPVDLTTHAAETLVPDPTATLPDGSCSRFVRPSGRSWAIDGEIWTYYGVGLRTADDVAALTDAQLLDAVHAKFDRIAVEVDGRIVGSYYRLDHRDGAVIFTNPLPSNTVVRLHYWLPPEAYEIQSQLEGWRVTGVAGQQVGSGTLARWLLPALSHIGRVREPLLPADPLPLTPINNFLLRYSDPAETLHAARTVFRMWAAGSQLWAWAPSKSTPLSVTEDEDAAAQRQPVAWMGLLYVADAAGNIDTLADAPFDVTDEPAADVAAGSEMWAAISPYALFLSTDMGEQWARIEPSAAVGTLLRVAVGGSHDNIVLVASTTGIWAYDVDGDTWQQITECSDVDDVGAGGGTLLYVTDGGNLHYSVDAGSSWQEIALGRPGSVTDIACTVADSGDTLCAIASLDGACLLTIAPDGSATVQWTTDAPAYSAAITTLHASWGHRGAYTVHTLAASTTHIEAFADAQYWPTVYAVSSDASSRTLQYDAEYDCDEQRVWLRRGLGNNETQWYIASAARRFVAALGGWDPESVTIPTSTQNGYDYVCLAPLPDDWVPIYVYSDGSLVDASEYTVEGNMIHFQRPQPTTQGGYSSEVPSDEGIAISPPDAPGGSWGLPSDGSVPTPPRAAAQRRTGISRNAAGNNTRPAAERGASGDGYGTVEVRYTPVSIVCDGAPVTPAAVDPNSGTVTFASERPLHSDCRITIGGAFIADAGATTHADIDTAIYSQAVGVQPGEMASVVARNLARLLTAIVEELGFNPAADDAMDAIVVVPGQDESALDADHSLLVPQSFRHAASVLPPWLLRCATQASYTEVLCAGAAGIWRLALPRQLVLPEWTQETLDTDGNTMSVDEAYTLYAANRIAWALGSVWRRFEDSSGEWVAVEDYDLPGTAYDMVLDPFLRLVAATDNGIYVWDPQTQTWTQAALSGRRVWKLYYDTDRRLLAVADNGIWECAIERNTERAEMDLTSWQLIVERDDLLDVIRYDADILLALGRTALWRLDNENVLHTLASVENGIALFATQQATFALTVEGLYQIDATPNSATLTRIGDALVPFTSGHELDSPVHGIAVLSSLHGPYIMVHDAIVAIAEDSGLGHFAILRSGGVWSATAGGNWTQISAGLSPATYTCATAALGKLFVGTDYGVLQWDGNSWQLVYQDTGVVDMAVRSNNGNLIVLTETGSVLEYDGSGWSSLTTISEDPAAVDAL